MKYPTYMQQENDSLRVSGTRTENSRMISVASFRETSPFCADKRKRPSTVSGRSSLSRRNAKMIAPEQTEEVFRAVITGLQYSDFVAEGIWKMDLIGQAQSEVDDVREGRDVFVDADRNHALKQQQLKSREQQINKLEAVRLKIVRLQDRYCNILKNTQASRPYSSISQREFKDVLAALTQVENEFESLLGTFRIQVREIAGFARLCPGDTFDLNVRFGAQKWKTRGKIGNDREQSWDPESAYEFACLLGEPMYIRVSESKLFTSATLCEKQFIVSSFFAPKPQIMSLQLNRTGSLKLMLMITWRPFPTTSRRQDENMWRSNTVSCRSAPATARHDVRPLRPLSAFYDDVTSDPWINKTFLSATPPSTVSSSTSSSMHSRRSSVNRESANKSVFGPTKTMLSDLTVLSNKVQPDHPVIARTVNHALGRLYNCIRRLEDNWANNSRRNSRDFSAGSTPRRTSDCVRSRTSPNLADIRRSSSGQSDPKWTTIQQCFLHHLGHMSRLLEVLNSNPDKASVTDATYKLEVEAENMEAMSEMTSNQRHSSCAVEAIGNNPEVLKLWLAACKQKPPVITSLKDIESAFGAKFAHLFQECSASAAKTVWQRTLALITDNQRYPFDQITVYQLGSYFAGKDVSTFLQSLIHEIQIVEELRSNDPTTVCHVIRKLQQIVVPPPPECLRQLALTLRHQNISAVKEAENYFLSAQPVLRDELISIFLAFLDNVDQDTRVVACEVLLLLKAKRSIGSLAALYRADKRSEIGKAACRALHSFGTEGKEAVKRIDQSTDFQRL